MLPLLILLIIATGMLTLSTYYLYRAFLSYRKGETDAIYYTVIGAIGIAITFYMTFILRKRQFMKKEPPALTTITECAKCGFKSLRRFTKGDYVYKTVGNCERCNEPMLITAVYAEPEKK